MQEEQIMNILAIETSCDETAAAVVSDGCEVLANIVSSQIDEHADYGGVVPELAAREHLNNIDYVVHSALTKSGMSIVDVEGVAVTSSPGLVPALLVGVSYARGLAAAGALPIVGVNHFIGHLYSCFIREPKLLQESKMYPLVALVVSGGHTAIIRLEKDGSAAILGRTLDDAAGEAFDKGAQIMELGYPGGPLIERLAADGDRESYDFPRGLTGGRGKPVAVENKYNFSFSGLKTALLYKLKERTPSEEEVKNLAASYQEAVVDVLCKKTLAAAQDCDAPTVLLCGGVACNSRLRNIMAAKTEEHAKRLVTAPQWLCTDNGAMIGGLGYQYIRYAETPDTAVRVSARLPQNLGILPFAPESPGRLKESRESTAVMGDL